ncbi:hypothetical protein L218DRAFT_716587 [Marasmius fiardii PR-910]|nr:hypothetical protein L218DRAFT_716587 [Marasmius fiardii PR-910]
MSDMSDVEDIRRACRRELKCEVKFFTLLQHILAKLYFQRQHTLPRMKISTFLSLITFATLSRAAIVAYPRGYTPTPEQHTRNLALAAESPSQNETSASATSLDVLSTRATAAGCVQAHCGYTGDPIAGDAIQLQIYSNGEYIFLLDAGQRGWSDNTVIEWVSAQDYRGQYWGFRMTGLCGKFEYKNLLQFDYGYYAVGSNGRQFTTEVCEFDKLKCTYYEATYNDEANCAGHTPPGMCDYVGVCGKPTGGVTKFCHPNGGSANAPCSNL